MVTGRCRCVSYGYVDCPTLGCLSTRFGNHSLSLLLSKCDLSLSKLWYFSVAHLPDFPPEVPVPSWKTLPRAGSVPSEEPCGTPVLQLAPHRVVPPPTGTARGPSTGSLLLCEFLKDRALCILSSCRRKPAECLVRRSKWRDGPQRASVALSS